MFKNNIVSYGITGKFGFLHTKISIFYNTKISSGVNYKKSGGVILKIPIFSTLIKSVKVSKCLISIIFVPFFLCKNVILESIYSGIKIIVCISENISIFDIIKIKYFCQKYKIIFIGPNSPGIIIPNLKLRLGLFPLQNIIPGILSIISKSGTLTYEAIKYSNIFKIGQSIVIGIGGDVVSGVNYKKIIKICLKNFNTEKILIIGEIGGNLELLISKIKNKKRIIFYIVGIFAPMEKRMGHAGAINKIIFDVLIKIKKIKKKFFLINTFKELKLI